MNPGAASGVLAYSHIVGQEQLKLALELSYLAPKIGGVLISGERGTAKSTAVRAFSIMMYDQLPVTLPINATDDRVLGGLAIDELLSGRVTEQPGLLEEAAGAGLLYIDEVNLLDDHIVNIILDVSSTGLLSVQREGVDRRMSLSFSLVGTMNPEEGSLRPQLLDRFGLMVDVTVELDPAQRREIMLTVLRHDAARWMGKSDFIKNGESADLLLRQRLERAKERLSLVEAGTALSMIAEVAAGFEAVGHRGDVVMLFAARALAALDGDHQIRPEHIKKVAPLALQHRRREAGRRGPGLWSTVDDEKLTTILQMSDRP
jgi:magnesium chelatase subunit I